MQFGTFLAIRLLVSLAFVAVGGYVALGALRHSSLAVRLLRTSRVSVRELMEETGRQVTLVRTGVVARRTVLPVTRPRHA